MFPLKQQIRCAGGFCHTSKKMCWGGELSVYLPHRHGFSMLNRLLDDFKACLKSSLSTAPAQRQICFQTCGANIAVTRICSCLFTTQFFFPLLFSHDSEGRLTNVTFPTAWSPTFTETWTRRSQWTLSRPAEEDVSITSNLSSIDSLYTMVQGKHAKHSFQRAVWNTAGTEVACGYPFAPSLALFLQDELRKGRWEL